MRPLVALEYVPFCVISCAPWTLSTAEWPPLNVWWVQVEPGGGSLGTVGIAHCGDRNHSSRFGYRTATYILSGYGSPWLLNSHLNTLTFILIQHYEKPPSMSEVIVNLDHLCLSEISKKGIYFFLPLQADLLNPLTEWITITSLNWQATIFFSSWKVIYNNRND